MVRTYRRQSKRCTLSRHLLETAIREVVVYKKSIYSVAQDLNLPKTSLLRYVRKYGSGLAENQEIDCPIGYTKPRQIFTSVQEAELVNYIRESANIYFGLTPIEVRKFAYECAVTFKIKVPDSWLHNKQAGPDWFTSFLKRHSNLSIRMPEATSLARATSFNRVNVKEFFTKLAEVMDRYELSAAQIYNVDETGITTVQKPRNIVAAKGIKQVGAMTSSERGSLITVCLAVNAIGNVVPPMLVFPRINYKDHFIRDGPPCSIGAANKSGWMIADHFLDYMKHFIKHVRPSKDNPVLLLLDNHESHLAINIVNYAKENGVILLSFPPHCSHKLQPLDRSIYGPLKKAVSSEQDNWMRNHPGQTMSIYDLPAILREALPRAATPQNIVKGFAVAGVFPFNPEIFSDMDFAPSYVTDRPIEAPMTDDLIIEPGNCGGLIEETLSVTNNNRSSDADGWEAIARHLESIQLTLENVTGDGHCLLYALARSMEAQGINDLTVQKLCELLIDEVQNNIAYYEAFGTNRQDIMKDVNRYVTEKQYNTDTGDLIIAALCNSLLMTVVVVRAHASIVIEISQSPGRPGLKENATVHVALHGNHYQAVVPLQHEAHEPKVVNESNSQQNTEASLQLDGAEPTPTKYTTTATSQSISSPVNKKEIPNVPDAIFTPHTIRPLPKAGARKSTKGGRRKRKTAILTDTPEKIALEKEQNARKSKIINQGKGCKKLLYKSKTKKKCREYFCIVCGEPFSNSKSGEQWIQCGGCKDWSHVECVPSGLSYLCHNCDLGDSDFIR